MAATTASELMTVWWLQVGQSLDPVRYSVEAEKYRAAAGYMATSGLTSQHLYHGGSVDPVAAAAAKYLESSKNFNEGSKNFLLDNVLNKGLVDNYGPAKSYGDVGGATTDGTVASKAYRETAKLYMDSKNYAAEVQRAYMDAAAKSFQAEKSHDNADEMDVKSERNDAAHSNAPPSSVSFSNQSLANYYSQAGQGASPAALPGLSNLSTSGPQPLSGIVPLSLSQYAAPNGAYPPSGEYRRPLPVIF